ncbi:MAG TPA: MBL fold metallo-hydrolase [Blastocatellia bacterium]|jgi:glyoxylase-like metal-dependent hydrolase (beta-lactamase superfamily II)/ferredoxin
MALIELRHAENVAGDFFVDSTCIDCDLCRQIAPETFSDVGDQSVVHRQPRTPEEEFAALKALVTCPTASIGALGHHKAKAAVAAFPELIDGNVLFCGFASESSYGASSYLILRPEGNVLVDSPRFTRPLAKRIAEMGGVKQMFLTHRDDVADHEEWASHFNARRVIHRNDVSRSTVRVERVIDGDDAVALGDDLLMIPTPGHTRGHSVLLYGDKYLFSGDHLWWSPNYQSLHASWNVCWYSWDEQTRSMERLLDYRFEWVLPGHGRRAHFGPEEMREQLRSCVARMKEHSQPGAR